MLRRTGLITYSEAYNIALNVSAFSGATNGSSFVGFGATLRPPGFIFTDTDGNALDGTASSALGFTYNVLKPADAVAPEPGSVLLLASGIPILAGHVARRRRRRGSL